MSADKYPSIFSRQMATIVYILIFFFKHVFLIVIRSPVYTSKILRFLLIGLSVQIKILLSLLLLYSPIFETARVAKKILRIINTIASTSSENTLGYMSLDIICSSEHTVFLELRPRKTVRISEQIMSAIKYPRMFSRQMEAIVCMADKTNNFFSYVTLCHVCYLTFAKLLISLCHVTLFHVVLWDRLVMLRYVDISLPFLLQSSLA